MQGKDMSIVLRVNRHGRQEKIHPSLISYDSRRSNTYRGVVTASIFKYSKPCPVSANEICAVLVSASNKRHFSYWHHIHQAIWSPVFGIVYDTVINMFNDGEGCYLSVLARYPECTALVGQVGISR
jgi:hypothetical protein